MWCGHKARWSPGETSLTPVSTTAGPPEATLDAVIDPALNARLAQLGRDLEPLVEPLAAWAHRARPVLAEYRAAAVDLPESADNPLWLEELPEAADVMGLALGVARLLDDAAGATDDPGGWPYVEFLLGEEGAAQLRHGSAAAGPSVVERLEPVADHDPVGERLDRLEASQRRLTALLESLSLALGAAGQVASESLGLAGPVAAPGPEVRNPHAA